MAAKLPINRKFKEAVVSSVPIGFSRKLPDHYTDQGEVSPSIELTSKHGARGDNSTVGRSVDDFQDVHKAVQRFNAASKAIRTGRQRKKIAARTKGGEFEARQRKRRIYFCCISAEVDVERLADLFSKHLQPRSVKAQSQQQQQHEQASPSAHSPQENADEIASAQEAHGVTSKFCGTMFDEVLYLSKQHDVFISSSNGNVGPGHRLTDGGAYARSDGEASSNEEDEGYGFYDRRRLSAPEDITAATAAAAGGNIDVLPYFGTAVRQGQHLTHKDSYDAESDYVRTRTSTVLSASVPIAAGTAEPGNTGFLPSATEGVVDASSAHVYRGEEAFLFGFGAIVLWGVSRSESQELLQLVRDVGVKAKFSEQEFEAGEDDMAFVLAAEEADEITVANDVIFLPAHTSVKSRLAISFAIAQSTVLSIFEDRIDRKIEDYRYIPERLAASGRVDLNTKQLGNMIGEVFVIQHDVNLHSEILDIPDFFWKEKSVEPLYRIFMLYMEMEQRIEVLNRRLGLMRELLGVLQQQHETAHSVKLEWIVIWLIVVSVVLEMWSNINSYLLWKFLNH